MPPLQFDTIETQATEAGFGPYSIKDADGNPRMPNILDLRAMMRSLERTRVSPRVTPEIAARYNLIKDKHLRIMQWAIEEIEAMDAFIKAHHAKATE